ncbi:TPA: Cna B-type domain-containing protein [Streptococcus equi subsp. zooepidemicus]|nr:Cna B-type domain-containing protein [Streptococcus equi subsp. zooepidemicus]
MKKKLPALLLVLVLVLTTMVSGLSAISANASGNEEAAVKQEEVVNTDNKNAESKDTEEQNTQDEKQSHYENDVATESDTKPLGLENEPATNSDVKATEIQDKQEPKQAKQAKQESTKININTTYGDDMDGFAPKIELINKDDGNVLFTLEKGKLPTLKVDAGTFVIDTDKVIDASELILKINDEAITVRKYGGQSVEVTVDGQKYEVSTNIWYNYDENHQPSNIAGINVLLHQIYKPEHQVLKVKKYWYDCHFEYDEDYPLPTVTAKISNPKAEAAPQKNAPQQFIGIDGSFIIIKGGRELASSEIPVSKVKVKLYVDGKPTNQVIELTEDGNWEGEFDVKNWVDKDGYYSYFDDNGVFQRHKLSLVEEGTQENAEPTHESQTKFFGKEYNVLSVVGEHKAYLINYEAVCEKLIEVTVEKIWKNENGDIEKDNAKLPEKIEVMLMNGDKEVAKKELNKNNNWKEVFKDLPRYEKDKGEIKYTIKEVSVKGYKTQITGDMDKGFVITNTKEKAWIPLELATRNIKVTKNWQNADGQNLNAPVEKIEVELYKDGAATGKKLELSKNNNWSGTFEKLAVSEKPDSKPYEYTIKEVGETGNSIKFDGKLYEVSYKGSMKDGFTIVNKENLPQIPLKPTPPDKPNKPDVPKTNTPKNLPKTGDSSNIVVYAGVMILSAGILLFMTSKRRKTK